MTPDRIRLWVSVLCVAALAGCAAPHSVAPPRAESSSLPAGVPAGVPLPPPAEDLASYALVRDDPAVAGASTSLAAASPAGRPAALMRRGREAFAAAMGIRSAGAGTMGFSGWSPQRERFLAYCELALRDFDELLAIAPGSPEAPEAIFRVGQINDYPNLNQFEEALAAYRLAVERYPSSAWAAASRERVALIEDIFGRGEGSPHAVPSPAPNSNR